MSNLEKYIVACARQVVYPINYLFARGIHGFGEEIKPKGFRDFLNGSSASIEYVADAPFMLERVKSSKLER